MDNQKYMKEEVERMAGQWGWTIDRTGENPDSKVTNEEFGAAIVHLAGAGARAGVGLAKVLLSGAHTVLKKADEYKEPIVSGVCDTLDRAVKDLASVQDTIKEKTDSVAEKINPTETEDDSDSEEQGEPAMAVSSDDTATSD